MGRWALVSAAYVGLEQHKKEVIQLSLRKTGFFNFNCPPDGSSLHSQSRASLACTSRSPPPQAGRLCLLKLLLDLVEQPVHREYINLDAFPALRSSLYMIEEAEAGRTSVCYGLSVLAWDVTAPAVRCTQSRTKRRSSRI